MTDQRATWWGPIAGSIGFLTVLPVPRSPALTQRSLARDAMALFNSGAKPIAIRQAIDKKYGPSSMPTPRPVS